MLALSVAFGRAAVGQVPRPRRPAGQALVRVLLSGICNTDLELVRGYHGFSGILGHEFVGVVEGPKGSPLFSRRVVGEINLACRRCDVCRSGLGRHCPKRTVLGIRGHGGSHAEWLTLPEANLRIVPDLLADEEAVFVEPLAAACEILSQVAVGSGTPAAVLGAGKLGLLVAQVLASASADVTVFGREEAPLADGILSRFGMPKPHTLSRRIRDRGFDLVVEASGSPKGIARALALVRPRGTIVWKSTHHAPARFDAAPLVVNEVTVVGSRCGLFEPAIELLRSGKVKVSPLISERYPLREARQALRTAGRKGVLKVLLSP